MFERVRGVAMLVVPLFAGLSAATAHAQVVEYQYTGTVMPYVDPLPGISVGDPVTGTFSYELGFPDSLAGDPEFAQYLDATVETTASVGPYNFVAQGGGTLSIGDDDTFFCTPLGRCDFFEQFIGTSQGGTGSGGPFGFEETRLILYGFSVASGEAQPFATDANPTDLTLSDWRDAEVLFTFFDGASTRQRLLARITSITRITAVPALPTPSLLLLVAVVLAALTAWRLRRAAA